MLVIVIALSQGMEFQQFEPSWLIVDQALEPQPISMDTNVVTTTVRNPIEPSFS